MSKRLKVRNSSLFLEAATLEELEWMPGRKMNYITASVGAHDLST